MSPPSHIHHASTSINQPNNYVSLLLLIEGLGSGTDAHPVRRLQLKTLKPTKPICRIQVPHQHSSEPLNPCILNPNPNLHNEGVDFASGRDSVSRFFDAGEPGERLKPELDRLHAAMQLPAPYVDSPNAEA